MSKTAKVLLGIGTILPILILIVSALLPFLLGSGFSIPFDAHKALVVLSNPIIRNSLVSAAIFGLFLHYILAVYFIVRVSRTDFIPKEAKRSLKLQLLTSAVAQPIYWYRYIWLESDNR